MSKSQTVYITGNYFHEYSYTHHRYNKVLSGVSFRRSPNGDAVGSACNQIFRVLPGLRSALRRNKVLKVRVRF